jgi:hypothetical protein
MTRRKAKAKAKAKAKTNAAISPLRLRKCAKTSVEMTGVGRLFLF